VKKANWLSIFLLIAVALAAVSLYSQRSNNGAERRMPAGASFRIMLGVTDKEETSWDGSAAVSPGVVESTRGWRFTDGDTVESRSTWKCSTRGLPAGNAVNAIAIAPNGVVVTVDTADPGARISVKTAQGDFSFSAAEIQWAKEKEFLDGRVVVNRVPTMAQLSDSTDEQDFPAIAQSDDNVYLSYIEFVHANRDLEGIRPLKEEPKSFDFLARPPGGDQVLLMTYSKARKVWSPPMAVSAPKQDVVRTTVAVDGQKRVWVFWSANKDGNFDIYGKALSNGRWTSEVRLTRDSGTDLNPIAATDSSLGRLAGFSKQ
jgi:hypothetical protein